MAKEELHKWQTVSQRLTAFPSADVDFSSKGVWAKLVHAEPEQVISRPREGVSLEAGPFEQGWLSFEMQPGRFDWKLLHNPNQPPSNRWMCIGDFFDTTSRFLEVMGGWLGDEPFEIDRIAFGANLILPVNDRKEGLNCIGEFVPAIKIDPELHDINIRLNRRRSIDLTRKVIINRLANWSVVKSSQKQLVMSNRGEQTIRDFGEDIYAVRLDLDINTVPDVDNKLEGLDRRKVFELLVDMATEIAHKGDIL